jgi:hypothetical protein
MGKNRKKAGKGKWWNWIKMPSAHWRHIEWYRSFSRSTHCSCRGDPDLAFSLYSLLHSQAGTSSIKANFLRKYGNASVSTGTITSFPCELDLFAYWLWIHTMWDDIRLSCTTDSQIMMRTSHKSPYLPSMQFPKCSLFTSAFLTQNLYAVPISHIHATWPTHPI